MRKIAICSGYFSPLGVHHLDYFHYAGMLDTNKDENGKFVGSFRFNDVFVIVNNDEQVKKKGSIPFMCENDRFRIVDELRCVNKTYLSVDQDLSVVKTLEEIWNRSFSMNCDHPLALHDADGNQKLQFVFCNGGDRNPETARSAEEIFCKKRGIELQYGVGGSEKTCSSSALIEKAACIYAARKLGKVRFYK